MQALTQFQPDELAEISDKMLLGPEISRTELLQVLAIEGVKLH
jgi:hypothetical protein